MAFDFHGEAVRGLAALRDILDRLIGEAQTSQPLPVDVLETAEHFILHAALPGMQPDDVVVQAQGNLITIRAELPPMADDQHWLIRERPRTSYARTIALPTAIVAEDAHARLADGLLTLHMPKAAPVTTITLAPHPPVADATPAPDVIDEAAAIITAHQEDYSAPALAEEVISIAPDEFTPEEFAPDEIAPDEIAPDEIAPEEPRAEAGDDLHLLDVTSALDAEEDAHAPLGDDDSITAEATTDDTDAISAAAPAEEEVTGAVSALTVAEEAVMVRADACLPDLFADTLSDDDLAEQQADIPLADVLGARETTTPVSELAGIHEESHS